MDKFLVQMPEASKDDDLFMEKTKLAVFNSHEGKPWTHVQTP